MKTEEYECGLCGIDKAIIEDNYLSFSDTDEWHSIKLPPPPNFEWEFGDGYMWRFVVKTNWMNRFKWWISTKLFLPGTYKWIK